MTVQHDNVEGGNHQPYAFGHCTNCHRLIIGWSAYQWFILVREPCPKSGKPTYGYPLHRVPDSVVRRENVVPFRVCIDAGLTFRPQPVQYSHRRLVHL